MSESQLRLAVALDGAGWHPAAWRSPEARAEELFTADYWLDLVTEAERGLLDFVTIEDSLATRSARHDGEPAADEVTGRLDAVLVASRVAPLTRHVGLVPTAVATHTEPFHLSKAIATLDYVSTGRAGVQIRVSTSAREAALVGRRVFPVRDRVEPARWREFTAGLFAEAADYVEVLRRLWDSWEDDAEIRDVATGRFLDRDKLHYIDFEGEWFSVRGPSITPRPPQGQPLVATAAHRSVPTEFVAGSTDLAFVTPYDRGEVLNEAARFADTAGVHVFVDLLVYLDGNPNAAIARQARLDALGGPAPARAATFVGTPAQLADLLQDWWVPGIRGFRLLPATLPHDLEQITRVLAPELADRGVFRTGYEAGTLRGLLGLSRPVNRYAAGGAEVST